jgi:hypothetical protein
VGCGIGLGSYAHRVDREPEKQRFFYLLPVLDQCSQVCEGKAGQTNNGELNKGGMSRLYY